MPPLVCAFLIITSKNLTDCMGVWIPGAKRLKENFASTGRLAAPLLWDLYCGTSRPWLGTAGKGAP